MEDHDMQDPSQGVVADVQAEVITKTFHEEPRVQGLPPGKQLILTLIDFSFNWFIQYLK